MKLGIAVCPYAASFPYIVYNGCDLGGALDECASFGYEGVDLFSGFIAADEAHAMAELFREKRIEVVNYLPIALSATGSSFTDVVDSRRLSYVAEYEKEMDNGALFGAPYMPIGFSRGMKAADRSWKHYFSTLADSVTRLSDYGAERGIALCLEPINRFEVNSLNTTLECLEFLHDYRLDGTMLLLDQFHMNIEDPDPMAALRAAKGRIGHFHAADSNRRGAGKGHCDFDALIAALVEVGYDGYLSMEAKPLGTPTECARECAAFLAPKLARAGTGADDGLRSATRAGQGA
jgi:sugar phosphate isomerase/epimerase